jgi:hypothetical protein
MDPSNLNRLVMHLKFADFKVVADTEAFLKTTANHSGDRLAAVCTKTQKSLS